MKLFLITFSSAPRLLDMRRLFKERSELIGKVS